MNLSETPRYLLDVNILIALTARDHIHNKLVKHWFYASRDLQWAVCAFTEAGFLRNATAPRAGQIAMSEATAVLAQLAQHPGYGYIPVASDWQTLSSPFSRRLYGTNQVTDAYLLGLAVRDGLILVTMDKAIRHLAGDEYSSHLLVLEP